MPSLKHQVKVTVQFDSTAASITFAQIDPTGEHCRLVAQIVGVLREVHKTKQNTKRIVVDAYWTHFAQQKPQRNAAGAAKIVRALRAKGFVVDGPHRLPEA